MKKQTKNNQKLHFRHVSRDPTLNTLKRVEDPSKSDSVQQNQFLVSLMKKEIIHTVFWIKLISAYKSQTRCDF